MVTIKDSCRAGVAVLLPAQGFGRVPPTQALRIHFSTLPPWPVSPITLPAPWG